MKILREEKIAKNLCEIGEKIVRNAEISSLSEMYFYTLKMNISSEQIFYEILKKVENLSNLRENCKNFAKRQK